MTRKKTFFIFFCSLFQFFFFSCGRQPLVARLMDDNIDTTGDVNCSPDSPFDFSKTIEIMGSTKSLFTCVPQGGKVGLFHLTIEAPENKASDWHLESDDNCTAQLSAEKPCHVKVIFTPGPISSYHDYFLTKLGIHYTGSHGKTEKEIVLLRSSFQPLLSRLTNFELDPSLIDDYESGFFLSQNFVGLSKFISEPPSSIYVQKNISFDDEPQEFAKLIEKNVSDLRKISENSFSFIDNITRKIHLFSLLFMAPLNLPIETMAITSDGSNIYAGDSSGKIFKINKEGNSTLFTDIHPDNMTVKTQNLIFDSYREQLIGVFKKDNQSILCTVTLFPADNPITLCGTPQDSLNLTSQQPILVSKNWIFFFNHSLTTNAFRVSWILARDLSNIHELSMNIPAYSLSSPVFQETSNTLFLKTTSPDGQDHLLAISPLQDRITTYDFPFGTKISPPLLSSGDQAKEYIFVLTSNGQMQAFQPHFPFLPSTIFKNAQNQFSDKLDLLTPESKEEKFLLQLANWNPNKPNLLQIPQFNPQTKKQTHIQINLNW